MSENSNQVKDLKPADYNPRVISEERLEELRQYLREYGDLSGVTFNIRTQTLVTGHQRLKNIPGDARIEKESHQDTTGTVAFGYIELVNGERFRYREVDWDLEREKAANIIANRKFGEFDPLRLEELVREVRMEFRDFEKIDLGDFVAEHGIRDIRIEPQIDSSLLEPIGNRAFRRRKRTDRIRFGLYEIKLVPEAIEMWFNKLLQEAEEKSMNPRELIKQKLGLPHDSTCQSERNTAVNL